MRIGIRVKDVRDESWVKGVWSEIRVKDVRSKSWGKGVREALNIELGKGSFE